MMLNLPAAQEYLGLGLINTLFRHRGYGLNRGPQWNGTRHSDRPGNIKHSTVSVSPKSR